MRFGRSIQIEPRRAKESEGVSVVKSELNRKSLQAAVIKPRSETVVILEIDSMFTL